MKSFLNCSVRSLFSRLRFPIVVFFLFGFLFWLLPKSQAGADLNRPMPAQQDSAESRLAAAVIAARDDNERAALIQAQPQLINTRFRHALAMEVLRCQLKTDHDRVLATLDFTRRLAEARGDKGWVAMTWVDSVGTYDLMGKPFQALAAYNKVPPLSELESDPQALAHVAGLQAFILRIQGRLDAALQRSRRALELFTPEHKLEIALAHCVAGMVLMDVEKFDESERHLKTSLQLFEELGDRFWTALPLSYLGEARHNRGESVTPLSLLLQSEKLSEEFGIRFLRYYTLKMIGHAYDRLGDINNQMLYHEKSLAEREALGDKRKIVTTLVDLAATYGNVGNYVKEFECAERALQLSQSIQYQLGISRASRQMAVYHHTV